MLIVGMILCSLFLVALWKYELPEQGETNE